MELSVAIQAKVEVTPSNWNFGFQPTNPEEFYPTEREEAKGCSPT